MSVQSSPNIAVVGGGIVGASIAWHLSHEANVTIVAEDIGGTATPNSFAWLNAAAGNREHHSFPPRSSWLRNVPGCIALGPVAGD